MCVEELSPPVISGGDDHHIVLRGIWMPHVPAADSVHLGLSTVIAQAAPEVKLGLQSKIGGRAAWRGDELLQNPWWGRTLTADNIEELDAALKTAMQSGAVKWDGEVPMVVSPSIFPLRDDGMAGVLRGLAEELENGSGATMLQGLPVERYTIPELSVLYLGMCGYIGTIVPQSSAGLRSKSRGYGLSIGHVKAEMRGKTPKDGKQVRSKKCRLSLCGPRDRRPRRHCTMLTWAHPFLPLCLLRRATTISGCTRTGAPQTRPALSVARHRLPFSSWSKSAGGSAARRKHGTRSTRRAAAARAHAWARGSAFTRRATVAFPIASLRCLLHAAPAHRIRSHRSPQPLPHPPNIDLSPPV